MAVAPAGNPRRADPLASRLDRLAATGRFHLRRARFAREAHGALAWAPLLLPAGPLAELVVRLATGAPAPGPWTAVGLLALGPALLVALRAARALAAPAAPRRDALALHDRNARAAERIISADDFISSPGLEEGSLQGAFMRAVVAEARADAERALASPLPRPPAARWRPHPSSLLGAAAAIIVWWAGSFTPATAPGRAGDVGSPPPTLASIAERGKPSSSERAPTPPTRRETPADSPAIPAAAERSVSTPPDRWQRRGEQPMDGAPGSGGGSYASGANPGARAAGVAPSQRAAPDRKREENRAEEKLEDRETSAGGRRPAPRPRNDQGQLAADANAGQGRSSAPGANLNPFEAPEEADRTGRGAAADAEDNAAEDEDEREKSGGANRPMGHTRDPAVDRNLSTRPPEDGGRPGDGRGGPGEIKKSRGVPSMILGLPLPDRVPGTPGAGRSKVTQEFSRPREESHAPVGALDHAPRSGAVGHLDEPDPAPWRRAIVENYFRALRTRDAAAPPR